MDPEVIHIDVDSVLRQRLPKYYRWMPRFVVRALERLICQDELNHILRLVADKRGVEATQCALNYMGITYTVHGMEHVAADTRYIFASNHPLGGLDGLVLISLLGGHYDGHIRFLVNDLLMAVKPLHDIFLPVNKYGRQSQQTMNALTEAYAGTDQMVTFPAGMCSRQKKAGGPIRDLRWNKSVVNMAVHHERNVVPIFFDAVNSKWFYRWARWRELLGIKFNVEMILLPREMMKSRGKHFDIYMGKPIPYSSFDAQHPIDEVARLREFIYTLKN
ncbi:MAG: 1-acyl-sn-glycerol-3-phosphate acyltransferase [Muribaculaceae bacterium]|nr:1-acyl-sn-glycerol-3-phosphate acyltransferase [Muribaculaceae bacterium]